MTNYEILKERDQLAAMEERLHEECWCCVNYKRCGEPASKPSREACKAMWRRFFKGVDTLKQLANRMYESVDCDACPASGMCGDIMCGCETAIFAWLENENLLYDMAMERS